MYDGDLITAVYSADCGGQTQSGNDTAIGQPQPYLRSTADREASDKPDFCSVNRTHEWTKTYTPQELESEMNIRLHPAIQGLKSVTFRGYDDSGRVKQVDLVDDKGTRSLTGAEFRKSCGYTAIRSLRMSLTTSADGKMCFAGKGWGHGVGLCQWGAEGLARDPLKYKYDEILKHYYPGVTIAKLPEGTTAGRHAVASLNEFMRRLFLTWKGKRR
jgi:stage II sporulation protein D